MTAAPSTSFPTSPAADTFMPSFAIATPVLQTLPPVVSVIELTIWSPPGFGGLRSANGSAMTSATINPKIVASMASEDNRIAALRYGLVSVGLPCGGKAAHHVERHV